MWWERVFTLKASVAMDGGNPYVGETVVLRLKIRHSEDGTVTELGESDAVSYVVSNVDTGEIVVEGTLTDDDVVGDVWTTTMTLPDEEGVYAVVWTVSIGGSTGKAKTTIVAQGI